MVRKKFGKDLVSSDFFRTFAQRTTNSIKIMAKITLIFKQTFNDDSDGSITKSIKFCSSIKEAKKFVLDEVNKGFEDEWGCLEDASKSLLASDINSYCDNDVFMWDDNGKGDVYRFVEIDTESKEYQVIEA